MGSIEQPLSFGQQVLISHSRDEKSSQTGGVDLGNKVKVNEFFAGREALIAKEKSRRSGISNLTLL